VIASLPWPVGRDKTTYHGKIRRLFLLTHYRKVIKYAL
jgi:hypothetical protein